MGSHMINSRFSLASELFRLTVPEYIPMGLAAVIFGFVASTKYAIFPVSLIFALISTGMAIAGYNAFNAIFDKQIDKINKPQRPLARETISTKQAFLVSSASFILALISAYFVNGVFLCIILVIILIAILYSIPKIHLKKRFVLGTLSAASIYVILLPLGGWAIIHATRVPFFLILYLSIFGFASAILKDFEDIIGDDRYKARTLPTRLGYSEALTISTILFIVSAATLEILVAKKIVPFLYAAVPLITIPALANLNSLYKHRNNNNWKKVAIKGMLIFMGAEIMLISLSLFYLYSG